MRATPRIAPGLLDTGHLGCPSRGLASVSGSEGVAASKTVTGAGQGN